MSAKKGFFVQIEDDGALENKLGSPGTLVRAAKSKLLAIHGLDVTFQAALTNTDSKIMLR